MLKRKCEGSGAGIPENAIFDQISAFRGLLKFDDSKHEQLPEPENYVVLQLGASGVDG